MTLKSNHNHPLRNNIPKAIITEALRHTNKNNQTQDPPLANNLISNKEHSQ